MAPKTLKDDGGSYTFSTDFYSFALVFYEVLIRNLPFDGEVQSKHLEIIRSERKPPLPHQGDYCP
jgi:serine/threonine protein kinase